MKSTRKGKKNRQINHFKCQSDVINRYSVEEDDDL